MATVKIDIKDYSPKVLKEMRDQVQLGLKAIGAEAEGYAKEECPVDTGRLRNSICWATATDKSTGESPADHEDYTPLGTPEENTVYIGTNVEYAPYVEYGDYAHTTGKKHFLKDAAANHGDRYKSIMEAALKAQ